MRKLIIAAGLFTVVAVVGTCGCQYAYVNQHEKEGIRPIKDIFDFRKSGKGDSPLCGYRAEGAQKNCAST